MTLKIHLDRFQALPSLTSKRAQRAIISNSSRDHLPCILWREGKDAVYGEIK